VGALQLFNGQLPQNPKAQRWMLTRQHREGNRPDVLNVLIASPSDVNSERDAVIGAIHEWNASHARPDTINILLNPIRWESHSYPESGDRPQALLNRQIVEEGDFLIGIFWSRVGTPTGVAESGTIEEIEQFRKAGKYIALYFSNAPLPQDHDREQFEKLQHYTLYGVFPNADKLREQVFKNLTTIVTSVAKPLRLGMWRHEAQPSTPVTNIKAEMTQAESISVWKPEARIEVAADQTANDLILKSHLPFTLLNAYVQTKDGATLAELPTQKGLTSTGFRVPIHHAAMLKVKQMEGLGGLENGAKGRIAYRVERGGQIYENALPFITEDVVVNNTVYIKLLG
jgi:hypothetical protein